MQRRAYLTHTVRCLLLLLAITAGLPTLSVDAQVRLAPEAVDPLQTLLEKGRQLETQRLWSEALTYYEDAIRDYPGDWRLRERLDLARIQHSLSRRYSDASFLAALGSVDMRSALDLYAEVTLKIDTHHVASPPWQKLVNRGTTGLDTALSRAVFRETHALDIRPEEMAQFRQELYQTAARRPVRSRFDAAGVVAEVAQLADTRLGLSPTAVVFEYVCGAADGLDNYSAFLTGNQLGDVYSQIEGNFVGLGVELKADGGALRIVDVIANSPAERSGIRAGDLIVAVDGRSTSDLSTDQAAALLQGPEGSFVDVTLLAPDGPSRRVQVRREHVDVPSVEGDRIVDTDFGVGYIQLSSFQKTTGKDLDTALWKLHRLGMRSLILDLRDNPGGLLTAAVDVADKFLQQGNIVSTRGRNPREAFRYDAHSSGTWRVPLVVLIDGDSASASEIFAASIRHYRRGTIVGSRSYGKGSVQGIFPLSIAGAGIRLTTAKFYSPSGGPISNVGVDPDIIVHETARHGDGSVPQPDAADSVLRAGIMAARRQLAAR